MSTANKLYFLFAWKGNMVFRQSFRYEKMHWISFDLYAQKIFSITKKKEVLIAFELFCLHSSLYLLCIFIIYHRHWAYFNYHCRLLLLFIAPPTSTEMTQLLCFPLLQHLRGRSLDYLIDTVCRLLHSSLVIWFIPNDFV